MMIGELVDVFDGDLNRWVQCRLESIGQLNELPDGLGPEVRVFRPIDETLIDPVSGLRQIYGIPWPAGEHLTRPPQWPAGH